MPDGGADPGVAGPGPIAILCAMAEEAAPFVAALAAAEPVPAPLEGATAQRGALDGREVVVVTTGIGLVAAAAASTWAVVALGARVLVSAGSAGGLSRESRVGDVAVGDSYTYGTADATEFGYERGQVPRQPVRFAASERLADAVPAPELRGRILSGDTFVTARNVAELRGAFADAVATDMESTAIAQVARAAGAEFVSVRGISDLCGPEAGVDFHIGVDEAAARSFAAVRGMLAAL